MQLGEKNRMASVVGSRALCVSRREAEGEGRGQGEGRARARGRGQRARGREGKRG